MQNLLYRYLTTTLLTVFFLGGCVTQPVDSSSPKEALVGWWEEYAPSSNIVHFRADGMVALYLKQGEVGPLHELKGTWEIEGDGSLQMRFVVRGHTQNSRLEVSFPGTEMVLKDANGILTRHRRHSGKLPESYLW